MATDGNNSYTVFTYKCGELNWVQRASASIGFSADYNLFENHPLSQQPNVNDIACVNQTCSPWTNVVYRINGKPGEYFCLMYISLCNYKLLHIHLHNRHHNVNPFILFFINIIITLNLLSKGAS